MDNTGRHHNHNTAHWLPALLLGLSLTGAVAMAEDGAIRLGITTHLGDAQHFRAGDEISLLLTLDRDAYLLLVYQDAAGRLVQLFPVRQHDDGRVRAGDFIPFPRPADGLRLVVSPPFGEERVWAFAAPEAFPQRILQDVADIAGLRNRLRDAGIDFSDAHTRLTTLPASGNF